MTAPLGGGTRRAGVPAMTDTTVSGNDAGATTGAGFTSSRLPNRWHS
ncbi:MAG: hypothetical protein QG550_1464 [Pseudomonadota bacterium]|nr:hypothetical protein [Pseudomonadota bacterium]